MVHDIFSQKAKLQIFMIIHRISLEQIQNDFLCGITKILLKYWKTCTVISIKLFHIGNTLIGDKKYYNFSFSLDDGMCMTPAEGCEMAISALGAVIWYVFRRIVSLLNTCIIYTFNSIHSFVKDFLLSLKKHISFLMYVLPLNYRPV